MKAAPLLVSWHNENAPIYSASFEPHGKGRLATAGGDNNVRVSNTFILLSHTALAWSGLIMKINNSCGKLRYMGRNARCPICRL